MSDLLKISGKRFALPGSRGGSGWSFERRPGGWVLATHSSGKRYRFCATEQRNRLSFAILSAEGTRTGSGEIIARSHGAGAGSSSAALDADLTAQFPGKVRKILVQQSAVVSAGDPLVLVEAMKMEFAVKAPVAGKVTRVLVKEGQQLSPGDRLLDFEPSSASENGNGK